MAPSLTGRCGVSPQRWGGGNNVPPGEEASSPPKISKHLDLLGALARSALTALRGLAYDPDHESMSKISKNESNRLNLSRLVAAVFAVDFGSLWWTPDSFWQTPPAP